MDSGKRRFSTASGSNPPGNETQSIRLDFRARKTYISLERFPIVNLLLLIATMVSLHKDLKPTRAKHFQLTHYQLNWCLEQCSFAFELPLRSRDYIMPLWAPFPRILKLLFLRILLNGNYIFIKLLPLLHYQMPREGHLRILSVNVRVNAFLLNFQWEDDDLVIEKGGWL